MRVIRFFSINIIWLGLISLVMGCATNGGSYDIAKDLAKYVNQGLLEREELERKPLEAYSGVIGTHYKNEQEVYETLKNKVIPIYERFFNELRGINPNEEDVKRVHGKYVRGAERLLNGFKMKMRGIENKDERMILGANEMIEQGSAEIQQWREELLSLCSQHGVAPEKKKEK